MTSLINCFCSSSSGDRAHLYSSVFEAGGRYCFQMFYHMYGDSIGELNVYVKPVSQLLSPEHIVWKQSGNQGDLWRYGFANATSKEPFQVHSYVCSFILLKY